MKITQIILHKNVGSVTTAYEATLSINDSFVAQVTGNENEASAVMIAHSTDCYHSNKEVQDNAFYEIDETNLQKELEQAGFENNLGWLEDHADITFN